MPSQIICNVTSRETRVALVENRQITELFIERKADQGIVGNIYKGVVSKVLPGMQVAFVDIGLDKAGFLYVSDVDQNHGTHLSNYLSATGHAGEPGEEVQIEREEAHTNGHASIEELLTEGQEIMVQASKDPMGSKGARITTYISLPGRYLVYMPTINQIGVSRRLESEEEKLRLKETLTRIRVSGAGYIIRTAAEGKTAEELKADVEYLDKLWRSIRHRFDAAPAPSVVYRDLSIILRSIRDLFTGAVAEALIDDRAAHEEAVMFCRSYLPDVADRINLYTGPEPVFTKFGIELDIERALGRRVWLKSGGYIVIDQTEALTAIDVNTGKFVGTRDQEETIVKTNLEAVQEIVYQLRLRNIGGLIIIDFIDMERPENKEKVYAALEQALKNDRSRTNILKISELGLVEMTRKRSRDSLSRIQTTVCPYCEGRGRIKSATTTLYEVYREIRRAAAELDPGSRELTVTVAPEVAELMFEEESQYLAGLEKDLDIQIVAQADPKLHQERFTVAPSRENVIK